MLPEQVRKLIADVDYALVASTASSGQPHLAASRGIRIVDADHLEFKAWFCHRTLENVAGNPQVAVTVMNGGEGYQLRGRVEKRAATAILNGFVPALEKPGMPQMESSLLVRVEGVMRFSSGPHSDRDLEEE